MTTAHDFRAKTIDGLDASLADYVGKTLLIVNVASRCGLTPHYAGLEALHRELAPRGFAVLGFPCNQFGAQEPGSEAEIASFCESRYQVTFPMFAKLEVNGANRHPLYAWLTSESTEPTGAGDVSWNFEKFVVDPAGHVVARFSPRTEPTDPSLRQTIERSLPA